MLGLCLSLYLYLVDEIAFWLYVQKWLWINGIFYFMTLLLSPFISLHLSPLPFISKYNFCQIRANLVNSEFLLISTFHHLPMLFSYAYNTCVDCTNVVNSSLAEITFSFYPCWLPISTVNLRAILFDYVFF